MSEVPVTSASDAPRVLHQDDALVAVDKPPGLAAHRSRLVGADDDYLVDAVRRATGRTLFLVHRLDRATSGLVLFAATREMAATLGAQFMSREVRKRYLAVCRGWPGEGVIDHPLDAPGRPEPRAASTRYRTLATATLEVAMGRYAQQRYALLELMPETGRYRQLRRHLKHISHHLIGDTSHGRGDHNRLFRMQFGVARLMLHALSLEFAHPRSGAPTRITASPDADFCRIAEAFGWENALQKAVSG